MKPRLLDLFCGGGGAGMGYYRAGFDVVGIDNRYQPSYPFPFVQWDALEYLEAKGHEFDVIHASPPCQGYSGHVVPENRKPKLIADTRELLQALGKPYVIENVTGAERWMQNPVRLCGLAHGRPVARHRLFESNVTLDPPPHPRGCQGASRRLAAELGVDERAVSVTGNHRAAGHLDLWREIMDMPWALTGRVMAEAIFPAFTEWIGGQIMDNAPVR